MSRVIKHKVFNYETEWDHWESADIRRIYKCRHVNEHTCFWPTKELANYDRDYFTNRSMIFDTDKEAWVVDAHWDEGYLLFKRLSSLLKFTGEIEINVYA